MYQQQVANHPKAFVVKPLSQKFKIKAQQRECPHSHIPNAETILAIKDVNAGIDVTVCKNLDDLFEQLGIWENH